MNESETRAELIDPKLREAGWGVVEQTKILREFIIAPGKIELGGIKSKLRRSNYGGLSFGYHPPTNHGRVGKVTAI